MRCQTPPLRSRNEERSAGASVPPVGRCAKGRRPQVPLAASKGPASAAAQVPQRHAARHSAHPPRSVESPDAPLLSRAPTRFRRRMRALRFPPGALLGASRNIQMIVEAPDAEALARALKGLEVRMAKALNKVKDRRGSVFADRYHAHLLTSPRQAANAVRYVLENWIVHAMRNADPAPSGVDPYCSAAPHDRGPSLVAEPRWWMLCVGIQRPRQRLTA